MKSSAPTSATYGLLADPRRRYLLWHLSECGRATVEEVATRIAAWERDAAVEDVPRSRCKRVAASLHHAHLPRLADHGVVDYDRESGEVVLTDDVVDRLPVAEPVEHAVGRP